MSGNNNIAVEVFSTCPQSKDVDQADYLKRIEQVARWSDEAGYRGILVYTDNGLVDPWLVSQLILQSTEQLAPLVAIQPIYMHPYTAAKMVASLAFLHERRIYLNMLAGGFKNDLIALNDDTPHDDRYLRTVEYTQIMTGLLSSPEPVTFEGKYYKVTNLKLTPPLAPELYPGILISGSSDAGLAAARDDQRDRGQVPEAARRGGRPARRHGRLRVSGSESSRGRTPTRPGASRSSASPRIARARSRTSSR